MTKGRLFGIILVSCFAILSGCIKNQPYVTTINPSMTASVGTYDFTAETVVPSTLDTQIHDSITGLIITGNTSDQTAHKDKIVLFITKYKGVTGTFSIVQQQAGAYYLHSGIKSIALGGVVAITHVTSNSIIGYFSFTTNDDINVQNGNFVVGLP
jgi:hypothetical protein